MANYLDDYEPVEDRLRKFWKDFPSGRVYTEIVGAADGDYIVKAALYRGDELRDSIPAATGLAHDSTANLPANMEASALEVCETSAIGRALANMNYAAKGKRPSREEMSKASPAPSGTKAATGMIPPKEAAAAGATVVGGEGTFANGEGASDPTPPAAPQEFDAGGKCLHAVTTDLTPDGRPLPKGRLMCIHCRLRIAA